MHLPNPPSLTQRITRSGFEVLDQVQNSAEGFDEKCDGKDAARC